MSGWLIVRRQPSTAVWGGVSGPVPVAVPALPSSGWVIVRRQPNVAVWGGIAAFSNVPSAPPPGGTIQPRATLTAPRRRPARAVAQFIPPPGSPPALRVVVVADDGDAPWHIRIRRRRT